MPFAVTLPPSVNSRALRVSTARHFVEAPSGQSAVAVITGEALYIEIVYRTGCVFISTADMGFRIDGDIAAIFNKYASVAKG